MYEANRKLIKVLQSCLKSQAVQSDIDQGIAKCSGKKVWRDVKFESDDASEVTNK